VTDAAADTVPCRLCATRVDRDAPVCSSCGAREPWIPDEPTISPWIIRLATWGGSIVLLGLLLFVLGMLMFRPAAEDDERDHRPPSIGTLAR
jgi:hypothetical protein